MSDPRQEQRQSVPPRQPSYLPTQVLERIKLGLSPTDDSLPFAQAVRQREEMNKAAALFSRRAKEQQAEKARAAAVRAKEKIERAEQTAREAKEREERRKPDTTIEVGDPS